MTGQPSEPLSLHVEERRLIAEWRDPKMRRDSQAEWADVDAALDTIENLLARVEELKRELQEARERTALLADEAGIRGLIDQGAELERENERLREALERIVSKAPATTTSTSVYEIAAAALASSPAEEKA